MTKTWKYPKYPTIDIVSTNLMQRKTEKIIRMNTNYTFKHNMIFTIRCKEKMESGRYDPITNELIFVKKNVQVHYM